MKIIVIGATGFIGRALVPSLLQEGHSVTAWVRNSKTALGIPCKIEVVDFLNVKKNVRNVNWSRVRN